MIYLQHLANSMSPIETTDLGQRKERALSTSIEPHELSEQEKETLVKKARIGNQVREKLFETVRERLVRQLEHPSIIDALRSIDEKVPYAQLDAEVARSGITLSDRAFHSEEPRESLFHAAIDIAKQKYALLDRMSTLTDERGIQSTLNLHNIAEIAEETLIGVAKTLAENQGQRDSIETKHAVMSSGDTAHSTLRQIHDAESLRKLLGIGVQDKQGKQSTKLTGASIVQNILRVEEKLVHELEGLMKTRGERIDRIALFRKIAANIRRNVNAFFHGNSGFDLRINQLDALKELIHFLEREGDGDRIGYFKQPTGAGKTVLYGVIARLADLKTLVLVPRTNLLRQTRGDLIGLVGIRPEEIGLVGEESEEIGRKYTIATYQSHLSKMQSGDDYRNDILSCELVVCDEAHKSLGRKTQWSIGQMDGEFDDEMTEKDEEYETAVLDNIGAYTSRSALKLGFTATPTLVAKSVEQTYKTLIAESSYSDLVRAGILKKFKVKQVSAHVKSNEVAGDIGEEQEIEILDREHVYEQLLNAYKEAKTEIPERLLGLASCPTIKECDKFSKIAESIGLRVIIVTNREYKNERGVDHRERAEQFLLDGDKDIIVTVDKLKEGWNFKPLNAVILARATLSPANVLQPAGRASRMFGNQHYAYIFEAQWRSANMRDVLSSEDDPGGNDGGGGSGGGGGRRTPRLTRPLTFADALYLSGERDIPAVCEGWHGERLRYKKMYTMNPDGTVDVNGVTGVVLSHYADHIGISRPTLYCYEKQETPNEIARIPLGVNAVPVYEKSVVDEWQCIKDHLRVSETEDELTENGLIRIQGQIGVTLNKYARSRRLTPATLYEAVKDAGIGEIGHTKIGGKIAPIYPKSEVDQLSCIKKIEEATEAEVDENGVFKLPDGRDAIIMHLYAHSHGIKAGTIQQEAKEAGIDKVAKTWNNKTIVPAFLKEEIDALSCVQQAKKLCTEEISDEGIVQYDGKDCVSIYKYAVHRGIKAHKIQAEIDEYEVPVVNYVRIGTRTCPVYEKTKIDALPCLSQKKPLSDESGVVMVGNIECVTLHKYSGNRLGNYSNSLKRVIQNAGLKSIGVVRSGKLPVEAYEKKEIDHLIETNLQQVDENGIVTISNTACVTVEKYAVHSLRMVGRSLQIMVKEAQLEPFAMAMSRTRPVAVYRKDDIDRLVEN